jgi:serine/threonine-protein kinase
MGSKLPRKRKHRGGPVRSVPSILGKRYPVHRLLGTGEYTERYEGAHPDTGERVVLEALRPACRRDPDVIARLRLMSALRAYLVHPNMMPLADAIVGGDLGTLGLISASGRGVYLDHMQRELGTLEPPIVAWIGLNVGQAVLHLENRSAELGVPLFHGAFGPEHVFMRSDGAVLVDGIGSFVFQLKGPEGRDALIRIGERLATVFPAPTLQ